MPFELQLSSRRLFCALLAGLATLVLIGAAGAGAAQAAPTPNSALILGSTVCSQSTTGACGTTSLEQQQAVNAGFTNVTVVSDATWDTMTTTDFEKYQLIIFGDPGDCNVNTMGPGSVAALTASQWEPAVMGSGGNKVLIGTTPTKHYLNNNAPDAPALEEQSMAYAGAVSGGTGLYLDLNCAYDSAVQGTAIPFLDGLSTQTGTNKFQVMGWNPSPPPALFSPLAACDTSVDIVASTSLTSGLTDSSLSKWNCSVHEAFTGFPSDYTPLVVAPSSSGFPSTYCANDLETSAQACGSPYILISGGGVTLSSELGLSPPTQTVSTSPASPGSATLTASVTSGGSVVSGQPVQFTVTNGPDQGQTQTVDTDSSGQAQFTITNSGVAGTDSVTAKFTDSGGLQQALATVDFSGPANVSATQNALTGTEGTALGNPVVTTITDPSGQIGAGGWTTNINWGDGTSDSSGVVSSTGTANQYNLNDDHTYAAPGTYTVTITVTDATNSADTTTVTTTATIAKGQLAVQVKPVGATEGTPGFSGQVATFTSTDHSTSPSSFTATIDWGDGSSTTTGTITAVTGTPGSFSVAGNHTYAEAGDYPVSVSVERGADATSTTSGSSTATILEATISVNAATINATTGTAFSSSVATFTDGDTLTPVGDYTATVQWGDGTSSAGTISGSAGSFTVSGSHTYASAGSFPLSVTVHETDGTSGTGTGSASSGDAAFTLTGRGTLLLPAEGFTGTLATIKYGNASALAGAFTAHINWGDGSSGPASVTGSGGNFNVVASHTFTGIGPYTVRITATDPATHTASATTTILIPSSVAALSIPGHISARKLLCGVKRHAKCTGIAILSSFRSGGGAVWNVSISKSGRQPMVLGQVTRKVTAGSVTLVFKVTNHQLAKTVYRMVRHHKLNRLTVQQVFTNAANAVSRATLFSVVTK